MSLTPYSLKELNKQRLLRIKEDKKTYYINGYSLVIIEKYNPLNRSLWYDQQKILINYLIEIGSVILNKKVLIIKDEIGLCGIITSLLGAQTTICEDMDHWSNIESNINNNHIQNKPKICNENTIVTQNIIFDYILVTEKIIEDEGNVEKLFLLLDKLSNEESKIIIQIDKVCWETEMFIKKITNHELNPHKDPFFFSKHCYTSNEKKNGKRLNILDVIPNYYERKQISPLKSNQSVLFQIQKKKISWLDGK